MVLRVDRTIAKQEGLPADEAVTIGAEPPSNLVIVENGLKFTVNLKAGQKTGFYLDQRDNRSAVAKYTSGKHVLDLFCYTGGFSLNALKHGGADPHARLRLVGPGHRIRKSQRRGERGGPLLDSRSPMSLKHRHSAEVRKVRRRGVRSTQVRPSGRDVGEALKGYLRLNRSAVELVEPGGILATCSCSGMVDRATFAGVLANVGELAGRPIQILDRAGHRPTIPCRFRARNRTTSNA